MKRIKVAAGVLNQTPLDWDGNRDRIVQVTRILLDNALRHTPAGGAVTVRVVPSERVAAVSVTDTGPGIAPEHVPRLFDRFYRADPARSRATAGAGLGLPIAQALLLAHGGVHPLQRAGIREHRGDRSHPAGSPVACGTGHIGDGTPPAPFLRSNIPVAARAVTL